MKRKKSDKIGYEDDDDIFNLNSGKKDESDGDEDSTDENHKNSKSNGTTTAEDPKSFIKQVLKEKKKFQLELEKKAGNSDIRSFMSNKKYMSSNQNVQPISIQLPQSTFNNNNNSSSNIDFSNFATQQQYSSPKHRHSISTSLDFFEDVEDEYDSDKHFNEMRKEKQAKKEMLEKSRIENIITKKSNSNNNNNNSSSNNDYTTNSNIYNNNVNESKSKKKSTEKNYNNNSIRKSTTTEDKKLKSNENNNSISSKIRSSSILDKNIILTSSNNSSNNFQDIKKINNNNVFDSDFYDVFNYNNDKSSSSKQVNNKNNKISHSNSSNSNNNNNKQNILVISSDSEEYNWSLTPSPVNSLNLSSSVDNISSHSFEKDKSVNNNDNSISNSNNSDNKIIRTSFDKEIELKMQKIKQCKDLIDSLQNQLHQSTQNLKQELLELDDLYHLKENHLKNIS